MPPRFAAPSCCPGEIGAIDPFDSHSTVGPTLTIVDSGGGPSHGATMRTSTSSARNSRCEPEHLTLHTAGA